MDGKLERSSLAAEAIDETRFSALIEALGSEELNAHSFMLIRNDKVCAEGWWHPYRSSEPHLLYSLTKSFMSTAIGLAVHEGFLKLTDRLVDIFPELVPPNPNENLQLITVHDLLAMACGHEEEPRIPMQTTWKEYVRSFMAHPVPQVPGHHFVYNTAGSNILAIILQVKSGESLDQFLKERLFKQIEIENVLWTKGEDFTLGGTGLYATTEAIAKFGLLYLNKGVWKGRQILPPGWTELATHHHVNNGSDPLSDWNQGYGYQFWRCRHSLVRGDGAFGQFCLLLPTFNAVLAMTSSTEDLQGILNAVYAHLLPAFDIGHPTRTASLFEDLELNPNRSETVSTEGRWESKEQHFQLTLNSGQGVLSFGSKFEFNFRNWTDCTFGFGFAETQPSAIRGAWKSDQNLEVWIVDRTSPHRLCFAVSFAGDCPTVKRRDLGTFRGLEEIEFALAALS